MKNWLVLTILFLPVYSMACAMYDCFPFGEAREVIRVDLTSQQACQCSMGQDEKNCLENKENCAPVLYNRFGSTKFPSGEHSYFEVIAYKKHRLVNVRMYNPGKSDSCARYPYPSDVITSFYPPQLIADPGQPMESTTPVCIGRE